MGDIKLIILLLVLLFQISVAAQKNKKTKLKQDSIPDYENSTLFDSEEILYFDLKLNKKDVLNDIGDDRIYHWAKVKYKDANGDSVKLKIKVKARGHYRRSAQNCNFPPLKLKIPKKVRWSENIFSGQSRIKLVVPCFINRERLQEMVMKEYLAYKMYNLFTKNSYKVRLVQINLIDSLKNEKLFSFKGFFIEETKQMAQRNNGKIIKLTNFSQKKVNKEEMVQLAVFQYFIGNTDWAVTGLHNIKLLFVNNNITPVAVPYDFDWCGFVNAPYAEPAPQIGTSSVKERVYRGYARTVDEYSPVIKKFNDNQKQIYQLFENNKLISENTKKNTKKYFDDFYEIINNPKKVNSNFIKKARK